jgi:hypothetical protein
MLPRCVSLLLLALALASSASAQAPAPAASSSPETKWTVLVYMLADNDLDCAGMVNLEVRRSTCSPPSAIHAPACLLDPQDGHMARHAAYHHPTP